MSCSDTVPKVQAQCRDLPQRETSMPARVRIPHASLEERQHRFIVYRDYLKRYGSQTR